MEFEIETCTTFIMKKGERETMEGIELSKNGRENVCVRKKNYKEYGF